MTKSPKYRVVAVSIVAVFLVFNVGLPIVIASCPMSETRTASCGMCPPASSDSQSRAGNNESSTASQKLTSIKNISCCITVFAADKNTTEFVKAKSEVNEFPKVFSSLPISHIPYPKSDFLSSISHFPFAIFHFPSSDIPIFTSSLLI